MPIPWHCLAMQVDQLPPDLGSRHCAVLSFQKLKTQNQEYEEEEEEETKKEELKKEEIENGNRRSRRIVKDVSD